jgi:hypothetical protein
LQWPDDPPRSIDRIAAGVSDPLKQELQQLSGISYGPNGKDWHGEALARALRSFSVVEKGDASHSKDLLPPLMPET